jgi:hypothetical protein
VTKLLTKATIVLFRCSLMKPRDAECPRPSTVGRNRKQLCRLATRKKRALVLPPRLEVVGDLRYTRSRPVSAAIRRELYALAQAYKEVAELMKEGDPQAGEIRAKIRNVIEKTEDRDQLSVLKKAYGAAAATIKQGDPQVITQLVALRELIGQAVTRQQVETLVRGGSRSIIPSA